MPVLDREPDTAQVPESVTLPLLREMVSTRRVRDDAGREYDFHSQVSIDSGVRLQHFVRDLDARTTLEVGLAFGTSALFICEALAGMPGTRRHIAIDPCQHGNCWNGIGLSNLRRAGFESIVDFRELPSHQAIPDVEREGAVVDFAFIDGVHTFDYALVDMFLVDRVLRVGGVMVIDDAEWDGVRKAIRYFVANRAYSVVECWGGPDPAVVTSSTKDRVRGVVERIIHMVPPLRRIARPELTQPDQAMGLVPHTRCVALMKSAEDDLRGYFGHTPF